VISTCQALSEQRKKVLEDFQKICKETENKINFEEIVKSDDMLCQFILDPTSLNLPVRVSLQDPLLTEFYKLSRDYCFLIDKTRTGLLKEMEKSSNRMFSVKTEAEEILLSLYLVKYDSIIGLNN
jgi:hypothetical protein